MTRPYSLITLLLAAALAAAAQSPLELVETRIGTAPSLTKTAGLFGKKTEEFGQCIPAVLEPHGMNFWTPQTRDTELTRSMRLLRSSRIANHTPVLPKDTGCTGRDANKS